MCLHQIPLMKTLIGQKVQAFQSLAVVESEIRESLITKRVEDSQYSSHFLARIWRDITRDYDGNALSGVSRYFPVVTEIVFLLLYLMIFVLGVLEILDSLFLNKNKEADDKDRESRHSKDFKYKKYPQVFYVWICFTCALSRSNFAYTFRILSTKNYRLYWYYKHSCISCRLWNAPCNKKKVKNVI